MTDPLFGISYDPRKVRFEEAPSRISEQCSEIRHQKSWVYAHLKTSDAEYFIVSGFIRVCPDVPGPCNVSADLTGTIVALRESKCNAEAVDSFYWAKNSPVWNLPEPALNELARDALNRYAKAFGGKTTFLKNVTHREYLAPALRKQLEIFEKSRAGSPQ